MKSTIVLDEETFDRVRHKLKWKDGRLRYYGMPVIWVEGGFKRLLELSYSAK